MAAQDSEKLEEARPELAAWAQIELEAREKDRVECLGWLEAPPMRVFEARRALVGERSSVVAVMEHFDPEAVLPASDLEPTVRAREPAEAESELAVQRRTIRDSPHTSKP